MTPSRKRVSHPALDGAGAAHRTTQASPSSILISDPLNRRQFLTPTGKSNWRRTPRNSDASLIAGAAEADARTVSYGRSHVLVGQRQPVLHDVRSADPATRRTRSHGLSVRQWRSPTPSTACRRCRNDLGDDPAWRVRWGRRSPARRRGPRPTSNRRRMRGKAQRSNVCACRKPRQPARPTLPPQPWPPAPGRDGIIQIFGTLEESRPVHQCSDR